MAIFYERAADKKNYHFLNCKKAPQTNLHFHSAREIILVKSGAMSATIDGERYEIGAGQGCFIDRFRPHTYTHEDETTEVFIFVGDGDCFEPALATIGGTPPVRFCFDDFELADRLVALYREQKNENGKRATFTGIVSLLLAYISLSAPFVPRAPSAFSEKVCEILDYVEAHCEENLTLQSLAREFGYTPQHFSRLFHKYLQINLSEYIGNVRVGLANAWIADGKTVTEAAFLSGFQSMKTFYRAYKRVFGTAPTVKNRHD